MQNREESRRRPEMLDPDQDIMDWKEKGPKTIIEYDPRDLPLPLLQDGFKRDASDGSLLHLKDSFAFNVNLTPLQVLNEIMDKYAQFFQQNNFTTLKYNGREFDISSGQEITQPQQESEPIPERLSADTYVQKLKTLLNRELSFNTDAITIEVTSETKNEVDFYDNNNKYHAVVVSIRHENFGSSEIHTIKSTHRNSDGKRYPGYWTFKDDVQVQSQKIVQKIREKYRKYV